LSLPEFSPQPVIKTAAQVSKKYRSEREWFINVISMLICNDS